MKALQLKLSVLSSLALATSGMVLSAASPASAADLSWTWSYKGGGSKGGSGTFTTTDANKDGNYQLTGITGTSEGNPITSLAPTSGVGPPVDNLITLVGTSTKHPVGEPTDKRGIGWFVNNETVSDANLYSIYTIKINDFYGFVQQGLLAGKGVGIDFLGDPLKFEATQVADVEVPPSAVPEPSSLLGYITLGGLILGSTLRKAFKKGIKGESVKMPSVSSNAIINQSSNLIKQ